MKTGITGKGNRFECDLPLANLLLVSVVMRVYVDVLWVELTWLETIKIKAYKKY